MRDSNDTFHGFYHVRHEFLASRLHVCEPERGQGEGTGVEAKSRDGSDEEAAGQLGAGASDRSEGAGGAEVAVPEMDVSFLQVSKG